MIKYFIFCSSAFLIFAFVARGFADEHFPFLAEVSKESVNVRAGPNTNFEKVDKLNKGTPVVVLGRSYEWLKVQPLPTTKSYIRSDYLKVEDTGGVAEVIGNNVNIRSAANSDAVSLGEVKKGTRVRVLEQSQGWSRLQPVAGTAVWINQDFLTETSSDVPSSMMILPLEGTEKVVPEVTMIKEPSVPVSPWVSLQGTVEALVQSPENNVHYEIVLGDKSVFFLQDIPRISYFCNTVVTVEGNIIPDPSKKLMYPLLHINKIALVL